MENKAFYNSDGDLLIVPQLGALRSACAPDGKHHTRALDYIHARAHTVQYMDMGIYGYVY